MKNSTADFENIMALAALDLAGRNAPQQSRRYRRFGAQTQARPRSKDRIGNLGMFLGASVFTSVVFVAGLMPGTVDAPQLWTHAFIALTLAQFAMLAGATLKATSRSSDRAETVPDDKLARAIANVELSESMAGETVDIRPSLAPVALSSGLLGGKAYVSFSDGSVEVDTMLGRRRFPDLNAAREFVGA